MCSLPTTGHPSVILKSLYEVICPSRSPTARRMNRPNLITDYYRAYLSKILPRLCSPPQPPSWSWVMGSRVSAESHPHRSTRTRELQCALVAISFWYLRQKASFAPLSISSTLTQPFLGASLLILFTIGITTLVAWAGGLFCSFCSISLIFLN